MISKKPEDFMRQINEAIEPQHCTLAEALEFLQELASLIDGDIDGVRSDIENADEEDEAEF